jgi:acetylglutamate kinase
MHSRSSSDSDSDAEVARVLSEALPYLQRYDGKIVVIKLGGEVIKRGCASIKGIAREIVLMKQCNVHPVVVHGGGAQIDAVLERYGIIPCFKDGLRVTDQATIDVVEMVLCGSVNKGLVAEINEHGGKGVGLCGKDGMLMQAKVSDSALGFVGNPASVNPELIISLVKSGFTPVIAPIASDINGQTCNINADTAAGAIAIAVGAERLLMMTNVEGVYDENGQVLSHITPEKSKKFIQKGVVRGGMIPKILTAFDIMESTKVGGVVILNGLRNHAITLELFTKYGAGTLISFAD